MDCGIRHNDELTKPLTPDLSLKERELKKYKTGKNRGGVLYKR